jgi:hypothetical protein
MALLNAIALDAQLERGVVASGVAELVHAAARHRDHARVDMQALRDGGDRSQRLEIALDDVTPGGIAVGRGRRPALSRKQLGGGRVDVVLPRREDSDVRPRAHARADAVASLEHERLDAAGHKMGGGRQAHGPSADHRDRKLLMHSCALLLMTRDGSSKIIDVWSP